MAKWDADLDVRDAPPPDEVRPHRSHKDRRRWCKGRPGREHRLEVTEVSHGWQPWWRPSFADVCTVCGKQFNRFTVRIYTPEWLRRAIERNPRLR